MRHRIEMGLAVLALAGTLAAKPAEAQAETPDIARPNSVVCTVTDAGMTDERLAFTRITRYKIGTDGPVEGSFRSDSETVTRDPSGHKIDVKSERSVGDVNTAIGRTWDGKSPLGSTFDAPPTIIKALIRQCNKAGSESATFTPSTFSIPEVGQVFVILREKPKAPVQPGQIASPSPKPETPLFVPKQKPSTVRT